MKKIINICACSIIFLLSGISFSQSFSQDTGKISTLFVRANGEIGIVLTGGFPNATATNQCPGNNGYAGIPTTADPAFKSAILAAKAAQQTIKVTISGCTGTWFKILDIYVE